jgi:hypothetical protein
MDKLPHPKLSKRPGFWRQVHWLVILFLCLFEVLPPIL